MVRLNHPRRLGVLAVLAVAWGALSSPAPAAPPDPVEELRQTLRLAVADGEQRRRAVAEEIKALDDMNDLRRAIELREWRDEDPDDRIASADRYNRAEVGRRFEQTARELLQHGDTATRLAIMDMLLKMATTTRGIGTRASLTRNFATDLIDLIKQGDALSREAATRALAQINPDPILAVPVLSEQLRSGDATQKLAAADGLVYLMQVVNVLATRNRGPNMVEATRADLVKTAQLLVPVAARGLRDDQPAIRQRCVQAIAQTAEGLHKLVLAARNPEDAHDLIEAQRQMEAERTELLPLIVTMKEHVAALTRALSDSDEEVRRSARRALEDLTSSQLARLEARQAAPLVKPVSSPDMSAAAMQTTVLKLASGLDDLDPRARRRVMDVLESLGAAAAPAAPAVVKALADNDPFVRWAAARTLGKMSPAAADTAVPALARMMLDVDLDLRVAAARALEHYGREARTAVPDLIQVLPATDAEMRVAVIRCLGAIGGPEAFEALPGITHALADGDARVQQAAAEVLGTFGPAARQAVESLRKALQSSDANVQKAAGEALLSILRPVKK
jgi:hypothetical protein